jgi:predicted Holliday junction resolvase-like endonuclease
MGSMETALLVLFCFVVVVLLYLIMTVIGALYNTADRALLILRTTSMNVDRMRQLSEPQQPRMRVMSLTEMVNDFIRGIDDNNPAPQEARAPRRGPRTRSDTRAAANAA